MTLIMYNQTEVKPLGKKRVKVVHPKNKKRCSIEFPIVSGTSKFILGLRASEHLQLLTVNKQNILAVDSNDMKGGGSNVKTSFRISMMCSLEKVNLKGKSTWRSTRMFSRSSYLFEECQTPSESPLNKNWTGYQKLE